jgi:hypothetical protein
MIYLGIRVLALACWEVSCQSVPTTGLVYWHWPRRWWCRRQSGSGRVSGDCTEGTFKRVCLEMVRAWRGARRWMKVLGNTWAGFMAFNSKSSLREYLEWWNRIRLTRTGDQTWSDSLCKRPLLIQISRHSAKCLGYCCLGHQTPSIHPHEAWRKQVSI